MSTRKIQVSDGGLRLRELRVRAPGSSHSSWFPRPRRRGAARRGPGARLKRAPPPTTSGSTTSPRLSDHVGALTHELAEERDRVAWFIALGRPTSGVEGGTRGTTDLMVSVDDAVKQVRDGAALLGNAVSGRTKEKVETALTRLDDLGLLTGAGAEIDATVRRRPRRLLPDDRRARPPRRKPARAAPTTCSWARRWRSTRSPAPRRPSRFSGGGRDGGAGRRAVRAEADGDVPRRDLLRARRARDGRRRDLR